MCSLTTLTAYGLGDLFAGASEEGFECAFQRCTTYMGPFFIGATLTSVVGFEHIAQSGQAQRQDDGEVLFEGARV